MSKRTLAMAAVVALVLPVASPAGAQVPAAPFSVTILEGPGYIVGSTSVYNFADPVYQACLPALQAAGYPGVPAPAINGQTGVFLPCFGPPVDTNSTFLAQGTTTPTVTQGVPFCVSTLGVCSIDTTAHVWYREDVKAATGIQPGAYSGSSKGYGSGHAKTIDGPAGPPLQYVDYTYTYGWEQSAGTTLPITGTASNGQTIVSFVTARSSSAPGSGTGGAPSATQTPAATLIFAVDGFSITFG